MTGNRCLYSLCSTLCHISSDVAGIYIGNGDVIHFCCVPATNGTSQASSSPTAEDPSKAATRSIVDDTSKNSPTETVSGNFSGCSQVLTSSVIQFCARAGQSGKSFSSSDYQVRRYRYGVKKLEADYLASYGTCTTLSKQEPEKIVRLAKFYAKHPHDFGEYEPLRTGEHFAIFCSTYYDDAIDEIIDLATPPSLMVPTISPEILKSSAPVNGAGPSTGASKGKVAAAATATCGVLAAGAMWGVAPAAVIGGALYASAKYVTGKQGEKQQLAQKKQD